MFKNLSSETIGILCILFAAFSYGIDPIMTKLFFAQGGETIELNVIRSFVVVTVIGLIILKQNKLNTVFRYPKKSPIILGIIQFGLLICLMEAFHYAPAPVISIIVFSYPLLINIYDIIEKRQKPSTSITVCLFIIFASIFVILDPTNTGNIHYLGPLLAVVTAFLVMAYVVAAGKLSDERGATVLALEMYTVQWLSVILLFIIKNDISDLDLLNIEKNIYPIVSGVIAGFAQICMFVGITRLAAVKTGLYMNFEIIVTVAASALFLGEILSLSQYIGCAVIIVTLTASKVIDAKKQR